MKRFFALIRRITIILLPVWLLACGILAAIIHYTGTIDEAVPADVIIVLGAGLTNDGRPNWALSRRSEHAAELWKNGYAETIICTGGVGRNVINGRSEADGCREVLMREGVPQSAIVLEDTSRSTEENALNTQAIMREAGWETAILVSDSYHVFRARYIFNGVGMNVILSPVPLDKIESPAFYAYSMLREVLALHWQIFKETFELPFTYVQFG
jgi:uncharacterized SAM-binding protein YcdF (DUF218 family)